MGTDVHLRVLRLWKTGVRCSELSGAAVSSPPILNGWKPKEQTSNAYVFVNVRPVNALTIANELESGALSWSGVEKPGKPNQGYRDSSPVGEIDDDLILRRPHLKCEDVELRNRNSHSMPPRTRLGSRERATRSASALAPRNAWTYQAQQDRARTSQRFDLCERERVEAHPTRLSKRRSDTVRSARSWATRTILTRGGFVHLTSVPGETKKTVPVPGMKK